MPMRTEVRTSRHADLIDLLIPKARDISSKLLPRLGVEHRTHVKKAFATEGQSTGKKWAALEDDYAKLKQRHVGGKKILVWDNTLRDAMTKKGDPDYIEAVFSPRKGRFQIGLGTKNVLARYHAEGVQARTGLKKRNPILKTKTQRRRMSAIIRDWYRVNHLDRFRRAVATARGRTTRYRA